ncbi:hypothetical protein WICPIJ_004724 [Wickerhamomyces pijperi]|uniref:Uncharacterized protein n=1 Tax=Wickerhamomyces pijperi TaxID=599730 RepID=A0A9P8TMM3_WICPI|nr:hypothetical protein WICPIJ_004724 [Wickerhamomyces pijperi]
MSCNSLSVYSARERPSSDKVLKSSKTLTISIILVRKTFKSLVPVWPSRANSSSVGKTLARGWTWSACNNSSSASWASKSASSSNLADKASMLAAFNSSKSSTSESSSSENIGLSRVSSSES